MGAAHSNDLRTRVVAAVEAGMSRRKAGEHFQVSASSAVRWVGLSAKTGDVSPRPRGGKSRSPLEAHKDWLLSLNRTEPDLTLEAMVQRVGEVVGVKTTESSLRRFFKRCSISFKKNPARR